MITVRDSLPGDVKDLTKVLRQDDRDEAKALNLEPGKALFSLYRQAVYRKTAFVDQDIAAMWGVVGIPLGVVGRPYLITGEAVLNISPLRFAKIYKSEVSKMQRLFPVLEQYVDANYTGSIRMFELAGFTLKDTIIIGPNKTMFYKYIKVTDNGF